MGKAIRANALTEVRDGLRVAEKILEAHGSSLVHRLMRRISGLAIEILLQAQGRLWGPRLARHWDDANAVAGAEGDLGLEFDLLAGNERESPALRYGGEGQRGFHQRE